MTYKKRKVGLLILRNLISDSAVIACHACDFETICTRKRKRNNKRYINDDSDVWL